jgi:hypothetical protein
MIHLSCGISPQLGRIQAVATGQIRAERTCP